MATDMQQRPQNSDWPPPGTRSTARSARSREGCLTCKRRKVKCDELRPRCSHCERLNLECKWRSVGGSIGTGSEMGNSDGSRSGKSAGGKQPMQLPLPRQTPPRRRSTATLPPQMNAVNQVFDFASFMWDAGDMWQEAPSGMIDGINAASEPSHTVHFDDRTARYADEQRLHAQQEPSEPSTVPDSGGAVSDLTPFLQIPAENHRLMDYFMHAVIPPILAEIETQKRWLIMRRVLVGRANASRMVRWAILAFSDVILTQREGSSLASQHHHYENALAEVVTAMTMASSVGADGHGNADNLTQSSSVSSHALTSGMSSVSTAQSVDSLTRPSMLRENLLAALFFLSYVDILRGRIDTALSNLQRAHHILQTSERHKFSAMERQFLLWLRLLDARAVSAGGEGLFLSPDDEVILVETPPAGALESGDEQQYDDIEDVLFQILYQPGIIFFQKVQSFMGRISRIDPWHRPRGTVEDEIEVMNIGAAIAADLRALYDSRPLLMDYAVSGRLTAAHVSANLAFAITRSFRTYLSNYYASKVHLHRVAYKTLPLTQEALDALDQIRRLARLLVEGLDSEEALPVNMLWPLLMLGSEELDHDERSWIRTQILRMEKVAGNSRITAQVLEEVQVRQDTNKTRVDIRSVMHDIFNASFAIV